MTDDGATNTTIIGRLLEEISWEGKRVRLYRHGGRGMENVLTAEVLLPLSYLPRTHFLAEVLLAAHGAKDALRCIAAQIEDCELSVLPQELKLQPAGIVVQPDALLETLGGYVLVEAKRIRRASFGPQQLAREYLAVLREAKARDPVLLLILGSPPPVTVKKQGLRDITEAIKDHLQEVLEKAGGDEHFEDLVKRIPEVVSWITWAELDKRCCPSAVIHEDRRSQPQWHRGATGRSNVHGNRRPLLRSVHGDEEARSMDDPAGAPR